jgi:spermidine synthase
MTTSSAAPVSARSVSCRAFGRAQLAPLIIVFFGGVNLILVQWVLVREMTALLLGTELVVLLVTVAYFVGLSVGYSLAGRIQRRWLPLLGVVTLALHLTLPVWFRLLVVWLDAIHAYWAAFIVLPVLTPLVVSSFYSIFLPQLVDSGGGHLATLYACELGGSACGVVALVMLGSIGLPAVYAIYAPGLLAILLALRMRAWLVAALGVISGLWLIALPGVNAWSNARWYEGVQNLPAGTTALFTGYSPYQKVDVLETPDGGRYLFLDGLEHFGAADGSRLNVVMGQIPAGLIRPQNALVIGGGSMQMAAMIADHAGLVTTVEIDPLVIDASLRFFDPYNRMSVLKNRRIVIDDAKHFLANSAERYDLVATDTPAAYSIQTATLYSAPFDQTIAKHLTPHGVLVANLTSTFVPDNLVSRRIAASLLTAFKQVIVITPKSAGWSFAYASNDPPFARQAIENALRDSGEVQFVIFDTPAVKAIVGGAPPITLDSMDIVLHVSAKWITDRLK